MIYLLHFERSYHHARHYIGFCEEDLDARMARHRAGHGAKLLRAVGVAGIAWKVARTWPDGSRDQERKLKNRKNARRLCPLCMNRGTPRRKGQR